MVVGLALRPLLRLATHGAPLLAVGALSVGCGVTHLARPLDEGAVRIDTSVGGPVVLFGGAPIPTPLSVVSVAYGVTDSVQVHGAVHPTALLFGDVGATVGGAFNPTRSVTQHSTLGLDLSAFTNGKDAFAMVDPYAAYGFRLGGGFGVAPGVHGTVTFGPNVVFAPSPFLMGWKSFGPTTLELEFRWLAPWANSNLLVPEWLGVNDHGALSVHVGVSWDKPGRTW